MRYPEELISYIYTWAKNHPFAPIEVDCATAVMLKILDGKCKMKPESKVVMDILYDAVKNQPGQLLENSTHDLIRKARHLSSNEIKQVVYENRLLAETMISRPVMKGFKAMIREKGLFDSPAMSKIQLEEH